MVGWKMKGAKMSFEFKMLLLGLVILIDTVIILKYEFKDNDKGGKDI